MVVGFRLEKQGHRKCNFVATRRFVFGFGRDLLHWLSGVNMLIRLDLGGWTLDSRQG
jgi:hypothetical protein